MTRGTKIKHIHWFSGAVLILFTLLALIPFLWVICSSLKGTGEIFTGRNFFPQDPKFSNYPQAWESARLGLRFFNSIIVTLGATVLSLAITTLAGYSFAKLWLAKYPFVFYCYLFGMSVPMQAIVLSIFLQLRNWNLQNTRLGLIIAIVGTGIPFATFLMRNFFKDLPDSFGECAQLDGSNAFQTFWYIYLPLAKPGMLALAIFTLIGAWNEFDLSLVVLTDDKLWTITLGVTQFRTVTNNNYGLVFSSAVISFLPTVLLYCLFQRSFIEGITVGGEKG
ncbi:Inner membrane ABC transporter permease protein ycjP [uncultured Ruminococcus sp.]|nr:Inner membrane ABC transporter permease protein ycjP [uncultured Ruminococcus sp.]SCH30467.1 Inner membrane ABC transporter permease protein ycjP [uncultured Clostridium sp.]